jgi:hypothetical protein
MQPHSSKITTCPICINAELEAGTLHATGKVHFRPDDAKFLKLKTANVEVNALLCTQCGHVTLRADAEKVKALTQQA